MDEKHHLAEYIDDARINYNLPIDQAEEYVLLGFANAFDHAQELTAKTDIQTWIKSFIESSIEEKAYSLKYNQHMLEGTDNTSHDPALRAILNIPICKIIDEYVASERLTLQQAIALKDHLADENKKLIKLSHIVMLGLAKIDDDIPAAMNKHLEGAMKVLKKDGSLKDIYLDI